MKENEAIERIRSGICNEIGTQRFCKDSCMYGIDKCAYSMAIQALEEIQQYRAIGTVEEFKYLKEKEERFDRNIKMFNEIGLEIRNKAIDEFAERLQDKVESFQVEINGLKADVLTLDYFAEFVDEIAEEMRGSE